MKTKLTVLAFLMLLITSMSFAQLPVTPANAATGVLQSTSSVGWTAFDVAPTTGYDIKFDNDSNPANGQLEDFPGNGVAVTRNIVTVLSYNTTYYWHVRDTDVGAGVPGAWNTYSFKTISAVPSLASPANGAIGVGPNSVSITWNAVTGATHYRVTIAGVAGSPFIIAAPALTQALPNLTAGFTYNWTVESSNVGAGGPWSAPSASWNFFTNFLSTVANPSAGNYALGVSVLPTFTWTATPAATTYDLEVSSNGGSTWNLLADNTAATTFAVAEFNQLNSNTLYSWRVLDNISGLYSATWEFTTFNCVITISNIYPSDDGRSASIGWYITPSYNNVRYDLYYAQSADLVTLDAHQITDIRNNSTTIPGLTHGTTYYFLVRARNIATSVVLNYTAVQSFTTPGLPTPTVSYPLPADEAIYSKPMLYWYTGGWDETFEYEVKYWKTTVAEPMALVAQGVDQGYFATGSANTFVALTEALTPGSTYNWKVRTKKGILYSTTWSDPSTFRIYSTVPTSPITPTPSWPVNNATLYTNQPQLSWYLGTYATGLYFQVQWDNDGNWLNGVVGTSDWISDQFLIIPTALDPGTYTWRVCSKVGTLGVAGSWSADGSFTIPVLAGTVPTPMPTMPVGQMPNLNPTFKWYAPSTPAMEYRIRISTYSDTDPVTGMLNHPTAKTSTNYVATKSSPYLDFTFPGGGFPLESGSTYYWQVQARLTAPPNIESSWSYVSSFSTATGATAVVPVVGSPTHGQAIDNTSALLSWLLPVQTGTHLKYDVEYSKSSDFKNSLMIKNLNEPLVSVKALEPNATYYWRVASKNNLTNVVSNYSEVGSFNTGKVTAIENETLPAEFTLEQNYPNPFNPSTIIDYSLPANSFVTLKIYDMLGREVKTLINKEVAAGRNSAQWNGDDNFGSKVAAGLYIYRITANGFVSSKKMLLIK